MEKFLYSPGLSCDWHENHTETEKCCQAEVARGIYTVLDLCCPIYQLDMLAGLHKPREAQKVEPVTWEAPKR